MIGNGTVPHGRLRMAVVAVMLVAGALWALAPPVAAEGLPVIDFISPGGVVSD